MWPSNGINQKQSILIDDLKWMIKNSSMFYWYVQRYQWNEYEFKLHHMVLADWMFREESGEETFLSMSFACNLNEQQKHGIIQQVMLLGDSGVGKTCLLVRFRDGTFLSGSFISTVGIDFRVRKKNKPLLFRPLCKTYSCNNIFPTNVNVELSYKKVLSSVGVTVVMMSTILTMAQTSSYHRTNICCNAKA